FETARTTYKGSTAEKKFRHESSSAALAAFLRERLQFYLRDHLKFAYDVVEAVLAAGSDDEVDAVARAEALAKVRSSADFESISVAAKRIKNILRQANESGKKIGASIDPALLSDESERQLAQQVPEIAKTVESLRAKKAY